MKKKMLLAILLSACCISSYAQNKTSVLNKVIELTLKEKKKVVYLTIRLDSIIYETIAAAPGDSKSYPGGSGVNIHLMVKKDNDSSKIHLSKLSSPYYSNTFVEIWHGCKIEFIGEKNDQIKLRVIVTNNHLPLQRKQKI